MKKLRKQYIYFVLVTIIALFIGVSSKPEVDGVISYPTLESLPKPIFSDYNYWVKKPYVTLGNNLGEYYYDNYYSLALGNAGNSTIGMHEYDYYQNKYHYIGPGEEGVLFV